MEDYANASKEELKTSLTKVGRYVSKKNLAKYIELLENNQLVELATDLVKEYYDPLYQKSIDKYMFNEHIFYSTTDEGVEKVIEFLKAHGFEE